MDDTQRRPMVEPNPSAAETGYYARMLPPRDRPVESLGSVLNGMGAMLGVAALIIMPAFLGTIGVVLAGASLAMTRSRSTAQRFGVGFTIAVMGWLLGLIWATWHTKALWP